MTWINPSTAPMIPIVFCETRKLAEEWTYRYLGAAHAWAQTEDAALARIGLAPTHNIDADEDADRRDGLEGHRVPGTVAPAGSSGLA